MKAVFAWGDDLSTGIPDSTTSVELTIPASEWPEVRRALERYQDLNQVAFCLERILQRYDQHGDADLNAADPDLRDARAALAKAGGESNG